jgi:uncharacterized membrane protein SpoIIM required for sporulation
VQIDRFLAEGRPAWDRLDELATRAARHPGRLPAAELEELVVLYQRTSTHLSYARTYFRDPALTAQLSGLVGRASSVVYGSRPRTLRSVGRFFAETFPGALWRIRWFVAVSTALTVAAGLAVAVWIGTSTAALEASAPEAVREAYVEEDFERYYSAQPSAAFASAVFTNNLRVGVLAFAAGILGCLVTVFILVQNGANLGFAAGLFSVAGELPKFWGLILPHGLLELTAVFVAGGAGLRLGWTLIDPGDRPRGAALVEEGRRAMAVVLGLAVVFAAAGVIEGFVTGSALPTAARVAIGVGAEVVFLTYVGILGPRTASAT